MEVDALQKDKRPPKKPKAKAKAKGKAGTLSITFTGTCWYCEKPNHKAVDCRKRIKDEKDGVEAAKLKPKGNGKGTCFRCGRTGHKKSECRATTILGKGKASKGKRKTKGNGKGKGKSKGQDPVCIDCGGKGHLIA